MTEAERQWTREQLEHGLGVYFTLDKMSDFVFLELRTAKNGTTFIHSKVFLKLIIE